MTDIDIDKAAFAVTVQLVTDGVMHPDAAEALVNNLLKVAKAVYQQENTGTDALKAGDRIRILEDRHNCAGVKRGDVLVVEDVTEDDGGFYAGGWGFELADEVTGWERV